MGLGERQRARSGHRGGASGAWTMTGAVGKGPRSCGEELQGCLPSALVVVGAGLPPGPHAQAQQNQLGLIQGGQWPSPAAGGSGGGDRNQGTWGGLGHTARCLLRCLPDGGLENCGPKASMSPSIQWDSCSVTPAGPGRGRVGEGGWGEHRAPGLVDRMR